MNRLQYCAVVCVVGLALASCVPRNHQAAGVPSLGPAAEATASAKANGPATAGQHQAETEPQRAATFGALPIAPDLPEGFDEDANARQRKREFFEWRMSRRSNRPPRPVTRRPLSLLSARTADAARGVTAPFVWEAQGPAPMINGQIEFVGADDQVIGAIHTVVAHPANPDILYVGAVNGGIWRTLDATATNPTWTSLTDSLPTLSIGALDLDPTDSSAQTLVAAIGRISSFGAAGGFLNGLLATSDGGDNWVEITDPLLVGQNLLSVAARGPILLAGSNPFFSGGGLFRSADRGSTWTQLSLDAGETPPVFDIVGDPSDPSLLYLTAGGSDVASGIYRSTDTGASWQRISLSSNALSTAFNDFDANINNAEMAVAADGRLYVNVLVSGQTRFLGYTDDPGSAAPTWVAMDLPRTKDAQERNIGMVVDASPIVVETPTGTVDDASDTTPIVITTPQPHLLTDVDSVSIADVEGNEAANGTWSIAVLSPTTFELIDSEGSGETTNVSGTFEAQHGLRDGLQVQIAGVAGTTAANRIYLVNQTSGSAFELVGSTGNAPYLGGGTYVPLNGANPRSKPGSQGAFHASIVADPTVPTTVYLGGDSQRGPFPNFIGAENFSARLFRGDTTVPRGPLSVPSPQWDHLTKSDAIPESPGGGTADNSAPHADSREMTFDAGGDLIEVSDGGIYRRNFPSSNLGVWTSINGNLQVTEFHDIAYDAVADVLIGGTQDNNNSVQTTPGSLVWDNEGYSGDGGDIEVAALPTPGQSVRYGSAQFLFGFQRRVYDAANTLLSTNFPALVISGDDTIFDIDPNRRFVQDFELNAIDPTRGVIGTANLYETFDEFETLTDVSGFTGFFINGLAYGGRSGGIDNPDLLVYVTDEVLRRETLGGSIDPVGAYPGSTVIDLVLDPDESDNIFLIDTAERVWRTDATDVWTEVTGDLVIGEFEAIDYMPGTAFDQILVSGRDGVFTMAVGQPGVWRELAPGIPRAPVFDLDYDPTDDVLAAGTLGRGAFLLRHASCSVDGDTDFACDVSDNCPQLSNPDQANQDLDAAGDVCDCAPTDATAFATPGDVALLELTQSAPGSTLVTLDWSLPSQPGGSAPGYEVLFGSDAAALTGQPLIEACIEDLNATQTTDDTTPAPLLFYLVRSVNPCGTGSLGVDSSGTPRFAGGICP